MFIACFPWGKWPDCSPTGKFSKLENEVCKLKQTDKQEDIKPITKETDCELVSVGQGGNRKSEIFVSCLWQWILRCDGCMWITAVVFTRVRLTVHKRSCVLCRHRAINLFLKSYKKQWLETEEIDKNILITDLTVSTASVHCGAEWCFCRPVLADSHMTVLLYCCFGLFWMWVCSAHSSCTSLLTCAPSP